jgi:hypothetical protein
MWSTLLSVRSKLFATRTHHKKEIQFSNWNYTMWQWHWEKKRNLKKFGETEWRWGGRWPCDLALSICWVVSICGLLCCHLWSFLSNTWSAIKELISDLLSDLFPLPQQSIEEIKFSTKQFTSAQNRCLSTGWRTNRFNLNNKT